jgi:type IX secretion system substrate protein
LDCRSQRSEEALPIKLSDFSAVAVEKGIRLTWITASETENLGFIIERKTTGGTWKSIAGYKDHDELLGHGSTTGSNRYVFTDKTVLPGVSYSYRLGDVDESGKITWHQNISAIGKSGLQEAYPNPFNPEIKITYGLAKASNVKLEIHNLQGRAVAYLLDEYMQQGSYEINWQPFGLSGGVYFILLQTDEHSSVQKILYLK